MQNHKKLQKITYFYQSYNQYQGYALDFNLMNKHYNNISDKLSAPLRKREDWRSHRVDIYLLMNN